jgi:haloalkane dehalogenase
MTTDDTWVDRDAYPFCSRWLELPEGKLHYVDEGDGEPLLFVHGTPTWSFEYRHLIRALRGGHRCIAVDHLGFGLSDRPAAAEYTPERARRAAARVRGQAGPAAVHAGGARLRRSDRAAARARRPGRVARLVVLNSWMWSFADDPEMMKRARMASGALGRFLYRRLNASLRLIAPSAYGDRRKLTKANPPAIPGGVPRRRRPRAGAVGAGAARSPVGRVLRGSMAAPAAARRDPDLARVGDEGHRVPPPPAGALAAGVAHATVVELAGAGHWPTRSSPTT